MYFLMSLPGWVPLILCAEPPPRKGGGKVEDVDGLVSKLKELGAL
jgi:electron transfer flavoprotein beta subunit